MQTAFIDYETFWSPTHTLSKMGPIEYVTHPDTEIIACAIKLGRAPTEVYFGEPDIRSALGEIDWANTMAVAHNMSGFDSMLLRWRLGFQPAMWGCTLAMARPLHAKDPGLGLGKLVEHYRLGVKDATVLHSTKGRRLAEFTAYEREAMAVYNKADTDQCAALFGLLCKHYTAEELFHIDCNIRMLVEPAFEVDTQMLRAAVSAEKASKFKALMDVAALLTDGEPFDSEAQATEFVREHMASAAKFSALLLARGVEVPTKPSPTDPAKTIPALAKTDEAFVELQEHDDPVVAAATRARLAVRSTLLETRIESFLRTALVCDGRLPVPLKYCGADTTGRDSGEHYNPQNLPRIGKTPKISDALRLSLRAPPGYVVGVADQSGIELRVNHFLWKVPETMKAYASSPTADLYRDFAAYYYAKAPDDVSAVERQFGKVCHLGLGFGSGAKTFTRIARTMGGIELSVAEAENAVAGWRTRYSPIVGGWVICGDALGYAARNAPRVVDPWGLVSTAQDALVLPSGRRIRYPGLRFVDDGQTWPDGRAKKSWVYGEGRHKAYLSPPKVDENIVQALARDSVFECALRFFRATALRPVLRVHDELVYMFPESEADALLAELQAIMRTPPSWWPELVVWSEGSTGPNYGTAK